MTAPVQPIEPESAASRSLLRGLAVGGVALVALAVGLWSRYGTVVFMETMANAWAYCF